MRRDGRRSARDGDVDWRPDACRDRSARSRRDRGVKRAGVIVLGIVIAAAIVAPWLAPNDPNTRFPDLIYAPPTRVHFFGDSAALYINTPRLVSRRERRFEE